MRIAIGSDHRGVGLKSSLAGYLRQHGHEVVDHGAYEEHGVDYPDIASAVAHAVAGGAAERGVLICGTGIGMAITANKVPGVRATTCGDEATAEICRRHNDVNVLCLAGSPVEPGKVEHMLKIWLETPFEGDGIPGGWRKLVSWSVLVGGGQPKTQKPADLGVPDVATTLASKQDCFYFPRRSSRPSHSASEGWYWFAGNAYRKRLRKAPA